MGAHTSKSSAMGGGGATESSNTAPRGTVGALSKLQAGATRSEIREALDSLPGNATFYTYRDENGVVGAFDEVQKLPNGDFRVYGKDREGNVVTNMEMTARELAKRYDGSGASRFHTEYPDTTSRTQITGRTTYTHDGMQFKNGTYDTLKQTREKKTRKFAQQGQIATYDGQQYGVTKSGGEYFTTHISTGMLIGRGQKTWSGVTQQIQQASELIKRRGSRAMDQAADRLNRTIRGD